MISATGAATRQSSATQWRSLSRLVSGGRTLAGAPPSGSVYTPPP